MVNVMKKKKVSNKKGLKEKLIGDLKSDLKEGIGIVGKELSKIRERNVKRLENMEKEDREKKEKGLMHDNVSVLRNDIFGEKSETENVKKLKKSLKNEKDE